MLIRPVVAAALITLPAWARAAPTRHHRHHPLVALASSPGVAAFSAQPAPPEPGSPAPVPNPSVRPPATYHAPETTLSPAIMGLNYPDIGNGYVPGSSPLAMDDRNAAKAPGVQIAIPIPAPVPPPLPPVGELAANLPAR